MVKREIYFVHAAFNLETAGDGYGIIAYNIYTVDIFAVHVEWSNPELLMCAFFEGNGAKSIRFLIFNERTACFFRLR